MINREGEIRPARPSALVGRTRWLSLACSGLLLLGSASHAADPAWWGARGAVTANAAPSPNAVVNQGQLKQFTSSAVQELNVSLAGVGGAGDALNGLIAGWQQDYAMHAYATDPNNPSRPYKPADFDAVTVGQLKYIAGLIYGRLQSGGYLAAAPAWLKTNAAVDSNLAVLGQLKSVFNFDLGLDPDGSGLPIAWENQYFGHTGVDPNADDDGDGLTNLQEFQQGADPRDFFNGHAPVLTKASGDSQTGNPGSLLPAALAVKVTDSAGAAIANAPIVFQVVSGGGQLKRVSNAAPAASCAVRSDNTGVVRAYFILPAAANAACQIQASASRGSQGSTLLAQPFTARSDNGGGSFGSPFALTDCIETVNSDGSEDLTWTNCPENLDPIPIWSLVSGTWTQVDTVPAGTTSYHFAQP